MNIGWFLPAIGGVVLYSAVIFVDKYLLEKRLPDSRGIVIYTSLVSFTIGLMMWVIIGMPIIPFQPSILLIISGLLVIGSTALYFHVLAEENSSFVQIFFQLIPVFVIGGAFMLGERLTIFQLAGSLIVIMGTIALAKIDEGPGQNHTNISMRSIWFMLAYDLMWAISVLCVKSASSNITFFQLVSYESFGVGVGGLALYLFHKPIQKSFSKLRKSIHPSTMIIIILNEGVLFLFGKSLMNYAYTLGSASLVSVVESAQILIILFVGFFLSKTWPKIFQENTDNKTFRRKLFYAIFVLIGIGVISS